MYARQVNAQLKLVGYQAETMLHSLGRSHSHALPTVGLLSQLVPFEVSFGQTECKYLETMWQLEPPLILLIIAAIKGLFSKIKMG